MTREHYDAIEVLLSQANTNDQGSIQQIFDGNDTNWQAALHSLAEDERAEYLAINVAIQRLVYRDDRQALSHDAAKNRIFTSYAQMTPGQAMRAESAAERSGDPAFPARIMTHKLDDIRAEIRDMERRMPTEFRATPKHSAQKELIRAGLARLASMPGEWWLEHGYDSTPELLKCVIDPAHFTAQ